MKNIFGLPKKKNNPLTMHPNLFQDSLGLFLWSRHTY